MEKQTFLGILTLVFTFSLFSWALGRFINKRKEKEASEFENFLAGAWILGLVILFLFAFLYFG